MANILIVDDEKAIRESLRGLLEDEGHQVLEAETGERGLAMAQQEGDSLDAVLLDVWLPGMDGVEVLQAIRRNNQSLPVIMISGHANIETAVKAIKLGAYHIVEKPFSAETLFITLRHAIRESSLERENKELRKSARGGQYEVIGQSPALLNLLEQVERAAGSDAWVLIQGENGTGKESVAHMIHNRSARKDGPFVEVNSAAIPEELIESELFGHEPGAFTGATGKKIGKFDQANGGTLFLDEIGDMSLKTQAKILRVLQEQRFERVGGTKTIQVNVRVLAATNKKVETLISGGLFREDLYYRLAVLTLEVPPLRHRAGDVALLVNYYLKTLAGQYGRKAASIHPDAVALLSQYQWPGNIRELRNIVERMIILAGPGEIQVKDIPPAILMAVNAKLPDRRESGAPSAGIDLSLPYREAKEAFERAYINAQLERHGGNISKTAEVIQLERSNLHKKIKQLDIKAD